MRARSARFSSPWRWCSLLPSARRSSPRPFNDPSGASAMQILVTGATGYIGTAVAESLARAGHTVLALVQSDASARKAVAAGHRAVRGTLAAPDGIAAAARDADAVVWTATSS